MARERKVRGSKIRASQSDKRQSDRASSSTAAGGTGRVDHQRRVAREGVEAGDGDRFVPGDDAFVETDAVSEIKDRVGRWLSADRPVHLLGPTGCGKTALAMAVARERDRPVVFINGDADLTTADLVGEFAEEERHSVRDKFVHNVQKSTDIVRDRWVDNPLTVAVREGATLVYNEFSRTKPVANNVLLSVFEEGVLELPGQRGENRYVEVHPEFRAVLTSNSVEYAGVHEPQNALLDRLVGVHVDFYDHETEVAILEAHLADSDVGDRVPDGAVEGVVTELRALRDTLDVTVGTRAMLMAVEGLAVTPDPGPADRIGVYTDVLGSKVPDHEAIEDLRREIARVVDA